MLPGRLTSRNGSPTSIEAVAAYQPKIAPVGSIMCTMYASIIRQLQRACLLLWGRRAYCNKHHNKQALDPAASQHFSNTTLGSLITSLPVSTMRSDNPSKTTVSNSPTRARASTSPTEHGRGITKLPRVYNTQFSCREARRPKEAPRTLPLGPLRDRPLDIRYPTVFS